MTQYFYKVSFDVNTDSFKNSVLEKLTSILFAQEGNAIFGTFIEMFRVKTKQQMRQLTNIYNKH